MRANETKRTILMPILTGDITEEAFGIARPMVADEDTRLVLVHVAPTDAAERHADAAPTATIPPNDCRWRRLASVAKGRTFVEAVAGDPAVVVADEAERFGDNTIVVGELATESISDHMPLSSVAREHGIGPTAIDALIEDLPVAVLVADRHGRLVFANNEARTLHVDRLDGVRWAVTRALLTEEVVRADDIELVAEGEPRRYVSVRVTPLRASRVGVYAAFVVASDTTARKRIESWTPVLDSLVNL